jgi:hypothetical protein
MPRPRKTVVYNAADRVIAEFFDRSMELKSNQSGVSKEISQLNVAMTEAGVIRAS